MSMFKMMIAGTARKNHGAAGIGVVVTDEHDNPVTEWNRYLGIATHNAADYEALAEALERALKKRMTKVVVYTESKLLLRQVTGQCRVQNKNLKAWMEKVEALAGRIKHFEISYIKQVSNKKARLLAEQAIIAGTEALPPAVGAPPEEPSAGAPAPSPEIDAEAVDGVTWRVLAFTPKIMLVQFNYKKGVKIPVHRHPQEQASYVIKGRIRYVLADKEVIMGPGLGIAIQGNSNHSLEAQLESIEIVTYAPMRGELFKK